MAPALPAAITGTATPAMALDTTRFGDWVVSPGGQYLVALGRIRVSEVQLEVYTLNAGRPDRRLLLRPAGSQKRVVLAVKLAWARK